MTVPTARHDQYIDREKSLFLAFELSHRNWKLGMTVGFGQKARERDVPAGDLLRLTEEIRLAKKRFGLSPMAPVIAVMRLAATAFGFIER